MIRHRVVITGMGVVSPLGRGVSTFADALIAGKSGIRRITSFDAAELPTNIAGEAPVPKVVPFGDRKIAFGLAAAEDAWADATACGTQPGAEDGGRTGGVALGVGLELFRMDDLVTSRTPGFELPPTLQERLSFMQTPSDMCAHLIAQRYGIRGAPSVHVSACAAGTDALGDAFRAVSSGRRRWMIAGGTDSIINPLGVAGFCALRAISVRNDPPERASRPFDRTRDGFVIGEGAGIVVAERAEDAVARGATIHGELAGYGNSFDAFKISDPHPEGRGAWQAMRRALDSAGLTPNDVDAINAHGTATPKNDPAETLAIKRLLGERASRVPVYATKSMIGHLISAAGAVEAIAALSCMQRGIVHPTINLHQPDPLCDLDYVPNEAREVRQRVVVSASYGFGGHNAAIVLRRWPGDRRGAEGNGPEL